MAEQVQGPDGRRWTVRRRWLPGAGRESLFRRFVRRYRAWFGHTRDALDADPGCLEFFGEGLAVGLALLVLTVVLVLVVIPLLAALVDLLLLLLVGAMGVAARVLLGRPWVVEAVADDGRELRREVVGWRASGAVCRDVAAFLADGTLP